MQTFAVVALLLAVVAMADIAPSWKDCGDGGSSATIKSVTWDPNPPMANNNNTIIVNVVGSGVVNAGSLKLILYANRIPISHATGDICATTRLVIPLGLGEVDIVGKCPYETSATVTNYLALNGNTPGNYVAKVQTYDENGNPFFCAELELKVTN